MDLERAVDWFQSCDWCDSQEDGHYCLLHSEFVKNMDVVRCPEWTPKEGKEMERWPKNYKKQKR